jgi:Spy/CpxP family protein refolding chaperone
VPVIEKARAEIAAALTPEQRAKFDKMLKEKERLWKR